MRGSWVQVPQGAYAAVAQLVERFLLTTLLLVVTSQLMINRIAGRYITQSHAYVKVRLVSGKWMLEHRALMENHLSRQLRLDEHVHHVDGDPLNNSLSNLEVLSPSEHRKRHASRGRLELVCPTCGITFTRTHAYQRQKQKDGCTQIYCSRPCMWTAQRQPKPSNKQIVHGKASTYNHRSCRCEKCTSAHADYQKLLRRSRKNQL